MIGLWRYLKRELDVGEVRCFIKIIGVEKFLLIKCFHIPRFMGISWEKLFGLGYGELGGWLVVFKD